MIVSEVAVQSYKDGDEPVADQWTLHGMELENCLCDWGCPCQFGARSTHGRCEAFMAGHTVLGHFNDINLDGLDWAMLMKWPGEVHEGGGTQQVIIDERANPAQREALRKILHGESTTPGTTHFFNYNAMMSTVLETLYAPIEVSIDVDQRTASLTIDGLVESRGTPLPNPGNPALPSKIRLSTPEGPRYLFAEMGTGYTTARAGIDLDFTDSYYQFNELHMNQDGLIR